MIVTYTPTGGEPRTWEYKPGNLLAAEAEAAEAATGLTFDEINLGVLKGLVKARRAVLWVLLKRDTPELRFKDVSFTLGELAVEWDAGERAQARAGVEKMRGLSDEDREAALALIGDDDDQAEPPDPTPPPAAEGTNVGDEAPRF